MAEHMKAPGKTIICMGKVFTHGQMEENMKENIKTIKSMDTVFTNGQMKEDMRGNGQMENNMEKVHMCLGTEPCAKVSGKMANEGIGLMKSE